MSTLWARLALLLVAAIVSVVALASLVAVSVIGLPGPEGFYNAIARQLIAIAAQAERRTDPVGGPNRWYTLISEPVPGSDPAQTKQLREALDRLGSPLAATVARQFGGVGSVISIPVAGRWVVVPFADPGRPPGGWIALLSWMLLIVIGTATVALVVAYRMTRPLHILETAVASVGTDGVLPLLPETGSAEVRATAKALNRLSARLKSAMESRMRVVAAAGHDLRTPMTRMRLRAEFIPDEGERGGWLKDLEELDHIADSAIGLVREEVEPASMQPLRLDSLVASIVDELTALKMPVKTAEMEVVSVGAARWALKRALRNLMINAATHGGGTTVSVTGRDGKAVVTILDEGPGIPPDLLVRVFEPFFQVDPGRRRIFAGAGLGLAIAKEIVDRCGGTITVENRRPRGLRQTVNFATPPRLSDLT